MAIKQRILLVIFSLLSGGVFAISDNCNSPYENQTLSQKQITKLIQQKQFNLCNTDLTGLDLSNKNLQNINLSGATLHKTYFRWSDLSNANLSQANISQGDLQNTMLINTDLRQANLSQANLSNSNLINTNLSGANLNQAFLIAIKTKSTPFNWADLTQADLSDAVLTNADFSNANLSQAKFYNTDLSNANFAGANLKNTYFQPKLNTLPNLITLPSAKNFRDINFNLQMGAPNLVAIRNAYRSLGMRPMERQITAMLKTKQMQQANVIERSLSYVFFYLTVDFGAAPGRPLKIFLLFILLFTIPYWFALYTAKRQSGIVVIWQANRFYNCLHHAAELQTKQLSKLLKPHKNFNVRESIRLYRISLLFSLLMAFQIGWRDFNIGNWITRVLPREYTLRAKGWVRIIAGSQSLISIYLLVLWALSYFGRPFEW